MCFTIGSYTDIKFKFIDSFQFMSSSIDALAAGCPSFPITSHFITNDDDLKFLTKKGVYPYAWFDDVNKFNYNELPDIECFYDDLDKVECKTERYEFARKVRDHFH